MKYSYRSDSPQAVANDIVRGLHELGISAKQTGAWRGGRRLSIVLPAAGGHGPRSFTLDVYSTHAVLSPGAPQRLRQALGALL